jgi:flagellin
MAISVNTNIGSLNAMKSSAEASKALEQSMARLSSGKRINSAADDAAGSAIASRLTSEIKGTNQAIRNALDAQGLMDTAEGAHQEVENVLQRMRELAVQSMNDTNGTSDRENIQAEVDQLAVEIDRIALTTTWAGKQLLNGTSGETASTNSADTMSLNFQIGASTGSGNSLGLNLKAISSTALGLAGSSGSAPTLASVSVAKAAETSSLGVLSTEDGTISLDGPWAAADVYTVDINDVTITVTLSASDDYTDDAAGFSAQLTDKILASTTLSEYLTVTDNGDGSVSLSQSTTPNISLTSATNNGDTDNQDWSLSDDTITFSGDVESGDVFILEVNEVAVTVTVSDADGFDESLVGLAGLAKKAIDAKAGITGFVTVTDNGDGSISLSQAAVPTIDAINKTTGTEADPRLEYDSASSKFSFTNAVYDDGVTYSATINGTTVSITSSDEDGFDDSAEGLANQLSQAINAAGITGITASASSGEVTLTNDILTTSASFVTDTGNAETSIVTVSGTTSASITITSPDDLMEIGDEIAFTVQGQDLSVTIGDDGFTQDMDGVAEAMKAAIDAAGLSGVSVAASSTAPVAQIRNVVATAASWASTGDAVTLVVGDTTLSYTAIADGESLATVIAGLQADADYDEDVFSIAAGAASINITFALSSGSDPLAGDTSNAVYLSGDSTADAETNVSTTTTAGTAATAIVTITHTPVVSGVGVDAGDLDVTLSDGVMSLEGTVASGDDISFTLDGIAISITAYSSSLTDTASQLVDAINSKAAGSVVASLNDDGTIGLSKAAGSANVLTVESASNAVDNIDAAMSTIASQRASLGALSNRLDHTVSNLTNMVTNLESSRGLIEDTDFAAESSSLAKSQILSQAATAMLAQANASKQGVLQLLQR